MSAARELGQFMTRLTVADLPAQTIDHATMLIASTLSSAAMGRGIDSARIVREMAQEDGGALQATIWYDNGPKLPMSRAAQANALASDAAASDDSDLRQIVHCGTPLVTTSLAIAEHTGASGDEILAAIVIGYELAGRVTDVMPNFRSRGFHGSTGAIFAAAGAAARLLRLDVEQFTHMIALTATSVSGLVKAADTSVAREYHCGNATLLGIQAARAAQRGYTGEEDILEMKGGFFQTYGGEDGPAAAAKMLGDLGASWDIVTDMAVKLVPGGHPYHAFGEAAANASREAQISTDDVESITVSRPGLTVLGGPFHPKNLIDMAHSPAYFTAAGVADRVFSWQHASPEKIADPVIHELIDRVQVGPPPTENVGRYRQGATVTIRTRDGRLFTNTVFAPRGSGLLGITWADIDAKYHTLMPLSGLSARQLEDALGLIHDFRKARDVSGLIKLLRP